MSSLPLRACALAALALAAGGAVPATFRCQGADGRIVYSDRPCPSGHTTAGRLTASGARAQEAAPPASAASAAAAASAPRGSR